MACLWVTHRDTIPCNAPGRRYDELVPETMNATRLFSCEDERELPNDVGMIPFE